MSQDLLIRLNVEAEVPHALLVRLDQVQALLLPVLNYAHVPHLLRVQTHAARPQRVAVLVHRLGGFGRCCCWCLVGHGCLFVLFNSVKMFLFLGLL